VAEVQKPPKVVMTLTKNERHKINEHTGYCAKCGENEKDLAIEDKGCYRPRAIKVSKGGFASI